MRKYRDVRGDGLTVTVRHPGERTVTFACSGRGMVPLRKAIDRVDAMGGGWRIISMSSVASIYRDLQGPRHSGSSPVQSHSKPRSSGNGRREFEDDPRTFEIGCLSKLRRLDLLAPLGWKA